MHFPLRAAPEPENRILPPAPEIARMTGRNRHRADWTRMLLRERISVVANDKWANPQAMWDERYSEADLVYGTKPNAYLEENSRRLKPGTRVLVPADGYGRNGLWLAKQGFQVHTADLSPVGVERARKAAQAAGLSMKIEQADLAAWKWPVADYDGVAAIFLHLPPAAREKVHAGMLRALKPRGILIFEAFSAAQLKFSTGGPKDVALLYTQEQLRNDFAGTEVLALEEAELYMDEGHKHRGLSAVVHG